MVASIIFLPLAIFDSTTLQENHLNWEVVMAVLYLAVGSSVAAYLILNYSLSKLPTYQVATFANLIPVVTISASWLFYRELLSLLQLIGALIVIMGISLVYFRRPGNGKIEGVA